MSRDYWIVERLNGGVWEFETSSTDSMLAETLKAALESEYPSREFRIRRIKVGE